MPEFDGRIITVPFSFKEIDDEGLISYVADPERCARVAGLAVAHARLRAIPAPQTSASRWCSRRTRPSTPASATPSASTPRPARSRCCGPCATPAIDDRRRSPASTPQDGDALIHALIERGGQDPDWLTDGPARGQPDPVAGQGLSRLVRHAARRADRRGRRSTGARRRASCSSTAATTPTARSSSPRCRPATSC